ncbi:MAG: lipopolysaccharide biosynthesis protein [Muribaculaceae bacterium]|nr:lipopolysaccharide biosynthesis protein [Muribaculaceae bacterium]
MSLKSRTARSVKWSTIDRLSSQVIYAAVGVVLANELSKEDFGLVGALTIFQAFAMIFVDSGFGAALLQKKEPEEKDYSTVFWFNLIVSLGIYAVLFFCAPLIADIFHDGRLLTMSRVMFAAFVINGLGIIQTNRLTKTMNMRPVAMANIVALAVSGLLGIGLALGGFGAWALVWQTISIAAVKTLLLWITGRWWPSLHFSKATFRDIRRVGGSVLTSSVLNTACLQVYNFVIGAFYSLPLLGVYTQADRWSKMGSASISQIMMSSFVPVLSKVQDAKDDFVRYMKRINRFTAFIVFPFMLWLTAAGAPLFHFLFGNKWDEAIPLFQILMVRGIFLVLTAFYNNLLLAKGKARAMIALEVVKDAIIVAALFSTVWTFSLEWLVWGQLFASLATWIISVALTCRSLKIESRDLLLDLLPFFGASTAMCIGCWVLGFVVASPILQLLIEFFAGAAIYMLLLRMRGVSEMTEALNFSKNFLSKLKLR